MNADTKSAAMWLHLLATRKMLNAAALSVVAECTTERADTILSIMATRGFVRGHRDTSVRKNGRAYTVDAACMLPRGVTLEQVLAAAGKQAIADLPEEPETDERESRAMDRPLPPRGQLGHLGRTASVFAIGARA